MWTALPIYTRTATPRGHFNGYTGSSGPPRRFYSAPTTNYSSTTTTTPPPITYTTVERQIRQMYVSHVSHGPLVSMPLLFCQRDPKFPFLFF